MARIRTIKPELWSDDRFVECSTNARLLFVAALNFASDYGVLPDKPKQLKMQCFPADSLDVAALVDELVDARLWVRRTAPDGANVLVIRTFVDHQRVDRPSNGRWGDPRRWHETPGPFDDDSSRPPRTLDEASPRNGREGSNTANADPPTQTKASEPDGFREFWLAYPRKVKRAVALRAWTRMTERDRQAAAETLPAHSTLWRAEKRTDRYIPHAATWLNARQWEDELPAAPAEDGTVINGIAYSADAVRRM